MLSGSLPTGWVLPSICRGCVSDRCLGGSVKGSSAYIALASCLFACLALRLCLAWEFSHFHLYGSGRLIFLLRHLGVPQK